MSSRSVSSTGLRHVGKPFKLRGRIDLPIRPSLDTLAAQDIYLNALRVRRVSVLSVYATRQCTAYF